MNPPKSTKEDSICLVTINEQGFIQSINNSPMFGYEHGELVGQKVNVLIPTPYREQHDSYLQNYLATGERKVIGATRVVEAQHKEGTIFPIRLAVSEVKFSSTRMFIAMLEKMVDMSAIITTSDDGIILSCNHHCEALFGFPLQELVGQNVKVLMPRNFSEKHDEFLMNFKLNGESGSLLGRVRNVSAKNKQGMIFPVALQVTKVELGSLILFTGRISKVDTTLEVIFTINDDGIIEACSHNFTQTLFGYEPKELSGQHINVLLPLFFSKLTTLKKKKIKTCDEKWVYSQIVDSKSSLPPIPSPAITTPATPTTPTPTTPTTPTTTGLVNQKTNSNSSSDTPTHTTSSTTSPARGEKRKFENESGNQPDKEREEKEEEGEREEDGAPDFEAWKVKGCRVVEARTLR
eukprot:TRINITY_DN6003_c0_g1_i1.p1 TRINITY_DN6003_c0_g1~~TRINITY_DN6003_c0_g1_i1.p1  ORF type:complete len:406 (-),score=114.36 TRINITY_DN6003_c0_g1_i1:9-1226(-)